MGRGMIINFI